MLVPANSERGERIGVCGVTVSAKSCGGGFP